MVTGVSEKIKSEKKVQNGGFLSMLIGTLCGSLSGTLFADKENIWSDD